MNPHYCHSPQHPRAVQAARRSYPGNLADVSPDGKRFLFALPVDQNQPDDIKVVLNWESGLKK
jgi:hypothetical protein